MALFRRKPKLQDEALSELAEMFISLPDDPTPGAELLESSRLDFSVESLGPVDDYLEAMRQREVDDEALAVLILRCGAYVGEVIRRHAQKDYHWLDYKGAVRQYPTIADFGESLGTAAVLWDGGDGFWFPLGKVMKFLDNGREDSVEFFAHAVLNEAKEEG